MADDTVTMHDPHRGDWRVVSPAALMARAAEGIHRRRARVPDFEGGGGGGAMIAINRARLFLYAQYNRQPELVSMTDHDYKRVLQDPDVKHMLDASGGSNLTTILGMWIERRANDDLPGIIWAEIGDIR